MKGVIITISERDSVERGAMDRERVVISGQGTVLVHTLEQGVKSRDFRMSPLHSVTLVS